MKLHTINTGLFKLDGGAMFGVVPKIIWSKTNPADEHNLCTLAMRCLLIEDGDRLILIDTGIGNKQDPKFLSYYYLHGDDSLEGSLAALGFRTDDITDVILTHLHLDHVGGAIKRDSENLSLTFKNATYWSNQQHWDWAINPNEREKASFLKENILPLQQSGQLQFIEEKDGIHFTDNISIRFVSGHTEAMMLPLINYNGKSILYVADLLPTVGHIPLPYIPAYDMFPLKTLAEKKLFLNEAAEKEFILFLEHDAVNECCTVQLTEKGVRLKQVFKLSVI
jgi:glyoxylase-like metal-dependent hydrolase (beta-lactamase superfamily II)